MFNISVRCFSIFWSYLNLFIIIYLIFDSSHLIGGMFNKGILFFIASSDFIKVVETFLCVAYRTDFLIRITISNFLSVLLWKSTDSFIHRVVIKFLIGFGIILIDSTRPLDSDFSNFLSRGYKLFPLRFINRQVDRHGFIIKWYEIWYTFCCWNKLILSDMGRLMTIYRFEIGIPVNKGRSDLTELSIINNFKLGYFSINEIGLEFY